MKVQDSPQPLSSWYHRKLSLPLLVSFFILLLFQVIVIFNEINEKDKALRKSIQSLSNVVNVALIQKNRSLLEIASGFTANSSGMKSLCVVIDGTTHFQYPFTKSRECAIASTLLTKMETIQVPGMVNVQLVLLVPRFPDIYNTLGFMLLTISLAIPVLFLVGKARNSIEEDIIKPLKLNIAALDFTMRDAITQGKYVSMISEINTLFLLYLEKIAEIKELTQKEREAERQAVVGRVITQISHDMRAPLNAIERLLYLPDDSIIASQKSSIGKSLHRLSSMIESLRHADLELFISRRFCKMDFNSGLSVISETAALKDVKLSIRNSCSNTTYYLDDLKFERAWINLVANAIDFAASMVEIHVDEFEDELVLKVIDDGSGVSENLLPRLFQRGATHGKSDGTGLGLAYVRQIMRGHGGDVTYRRENNLTIFECRLPNAVEPEKEQVVENAATMEIQLVQKMVRPVAICLEPWALTQSILAKLASHNSDEFFFTEERQGACIVVSNSDEVMFEVLERDDQEYISTAHLKGDERAIMKVLKRKFNLETEGGISV
ncbi:sensor histidine kinase [Oligoflexus tunisiensis]|uniref:sensor histidine kinase n=1 Tax=Oligoflexus tunisiensis TaxID=708132 RepID=UPI00114D1F33|nr:HAMP domain-containing sensor histidine kinase [Oligoflexus tunisiensis]